MSLSIGDIGASHGMALGIYTQIAANLEADLGPMPPEDLEKVRASWRKLAHAIATGVVAHLQANLELRDAATDGTPVRAVAGQTGSAAPSNHAHGAGTLAVTLDDLAFR